MKDYHCLHTIPTLPGVHRRKRKNPVNFFGDLNKSTFWEKISRCNSAEIITTLKDFKNGMMYSFFTVKNKIRYLLKQIFSLDYI